MRHSFKAQRRLAHLSDPFAQCGNVFGAEMRMQAETHLQFVERFGSDAGGENLVQSAKSVVIAF